MIKYNGISICENCFSHVEGDLCPVCGFKSGTVGDSQLLQPGAILDGKYIVGKTLGVGGFGITYLGYSVGENKTVAIKEYFPKTLVYRKVSDTTVMVSNPKMAGNLEKGREAFYNEAKILSRFNGNPHIVGVYEFFYENNTAYFVMEYLRGKDLRNYVTDRKRVMDNEETREMMIQIATALSVAHRDNILHRDVSNVNIFVCGDGSYKLIDFGAARQYSSERTQSMSVILNPGFAPLEQYQRHGKQGPWTDIYALGATAYWARTGQLLDDPMTRQDGENLVNIKGTDIDPVLYRIICKCINIDPKKRYQDMGALVKDLNVNPNQKSGLMWKKAAIAGAAVVVLGGTAIGISMIGEEKMPELPEESASAVKVETDDIFEKMEFDSAVSPETEDTSEPETEPAETKAPETKPAETQPPEPTPVEYYNDGIGLYKEKKYAEAIASFEKAAAKGSVSAIYMLGMCYEHGYGVKQDAIAALEKYRLADSGGQKEAADGIRRVIDTAAVLYYNNGEFERAFACFKEAAENNGKPNTMNWLAYLYQVGQGTTANPTESFRWYKKSADEHNNGAAAYQVGLCYWNGTGVAVDYETAYAYYKKSADAGYENAKQYVTPANVYTIGVHYYNGTAVTRNYEKAVKWFGEAEKAGSVDAVYMLGVCYENGLGVTKNQDTAESYYRNAAGQGHADAQVRLVAIENQRAEEARQQTYDNAVALVNQGEYYEGIKLFNTIIDYRDAWAQCRTAWAKMKNLRVIQDSLWHTMYIREDGTVGVIMHEPDDDGYDYDQYGRCNVEGWTDIVELFSEYGDATYGLRMDGTLVALGDNDHGELNVSGWTDIVDVGVGGWDHTVGLKADGTVVAVGSNEKGQCNVDHWTDIISIHAYSDYTVGLKADGTVVATGDNQYGQCNVSGWEDIVSICTYSYCTIGLKSDGTVVAVGDNDKGQCNVSKWTDIISIDVEGLSTIGLKADGTVVRAGYDWGTKNPSSNVKQWKNIVAISEGENHTVGLKSDGTVVACGGNYRGACDVSSWRNIVSIYAGEDYTIGVKSDGTILVAGYRYGFNNEPKSTTLKNLYIPDGYLRLVNKY